MFAIAERFKTKSGEDEINDGVEAIVAKSFFATNSRTL